jgi:glycosyltransferase involved in cell wall biosynthesis
VSDEPPLTVLHFATSDLAGGAAKGGYRTHSALRRLGIDSQMVVRRKLSIDQTVHEVAPLTTWQSRRRRIRARLPLVNPRLPQPTETFNFDLEQDFDARSLFTFRSRPDVVCVQRITRFLAVRQIRQLYEHYRRPLVWVMHDQSAVTGGCGFSYDCEGFKQRCGRCPQLRSTDPDDASRRLWLRKHRELARVPLTFVGQSSDAVRWVRESSLFGERDCRLVPQPVDAEIFRPLDRTGARERLGVPADAKIVFVGAAYLRGARKGAKFAIDALRRLAQMPEARDLEQRAFVLTVGEGGDDLVEAAPFAGRALGVLHDDLALALLFQAADVFLSPSLADSGPMMVTESLLCGRPVVAFATGVAVDLIGPPATGSLAPLGDSEALARGLLDVLTSERGEREETVCRDAASAYSYERAGAAYAGLFRSLATTG